MQEDSEAMLPWAGYIKPKMTLKGQYCRFIVLAGIFCFCSFCAFLAIILLPDHENAKSTTIPKGSIRHIPIIYSDLEDMKKLGLDSNRIMEPFLAIKDSSDDGVFDIIQDDVVEDVENGNDNYDGFPENDAFSEGDFDYDSLNHTNKPSPAHIIEQETSPAVPNIRTGNFQQMFRIKLIESLSVKSHYSSHFNRGLKLRNISMVNFEGIPVVEDKIYWSRDLEDSAPKGLELSDVSAIQERLKKLRVAKVQQPNWNLCGRPKNLFIVFEDGTKACARYRAPHQYLVQGEVLSFYLSRLLYITNVPVVSLVNSDVDDERWSNEDVRNDVIQSGWQSNTTVAFIQWIDDLERDKMPELLLSALVNKSTIHGHTSGLYDLSVEELIELLQWSDLIIFDYLTGNYDRVASMQDAADKEKRPSILNETIHNLVKSRTTNSLWMIDNESGLLDSYSLLYGRLGQDGRFLQFHKDILSSICLFRRSTVQRIGWLRRSGNAGELLLQLVKENEPFLTEIEHSSRLIEKLQERIEEVHRHIELCMSEYR